MILDTSFIIDLLNNEKGAVEKAAIIQKSGVPILTTAVTVFEIWQGASDLSDARKRERIEVLLSSLGLLSLDIPCAKEAGIIHDKGFRQGRPIDPEDSMIAGIARHHRHTVLTRNVKHFKSVDGISVDTY